jgi:phage terminase small subunit
MLCRKKLLYFKARMAGNNITRSAILAGCSEKTAPQAGSRMEKDREVVAAYARAGGIPEKAKPVKPEPKPKAIKLKQVAIKQEKAPDPVKVIEPVPAIVAREPIVEKYQEPEKQEPPPPTENQLPSLSDPIAYFRRVMNAAGEDPKIRLDAAKALAAFTVAKPGEKGKKEERQEKAKEVSTKFRNLRSVK